MKTSITSMLHHIHRGLRKISQLSVWIGGTLLVFTAILVVFDVIMRKLFTVGISGANEISGYVFSATTTWGFTFALLHRANVRIDIAYGLLSLPIRAILDLVGLLALFLYISVMTYYAVGSFEETWANNTKSVTALAVPLWIPQFFWISGLFLFAFTLAFLGIYTVVALLRRDWSLVASIAGIPSVEEAVREETQGVDAAPVLSGD